jgi:hypothetical protein
MKLVKAILIVVGALILGPILLWQVFYLLISAKDFTREAAPEKDKAAISESARDCASMRHNHPSVWDFDEDKKRRFRKEWIEVCEREAATDASADVQLSFFHALFSNDRRGEAIVVLRKLAAEGNAEAMVQIYEWHRSWEQGDVDKVQVIESREAGDSLRKAAESGHAYAMQRYAVNLEQGSIIKRDPDAAAYWMERTLASPPKDSSPTDLGISLGQMLTETTSPEQRARGIQILETRHQSRAKAYLGVAIRKDDPVRARKLLEDTLRDWPGISLPPLADMLIKGEGGKQDTQRAVKLLQSYSRVSAPASINEALGKLYADGKLVPRDLQKAAGLMRGETQWSIVSLLNYARFVADNPTVQDVDPKDLLYDVTNAVKVGEPRALETLIALKLSPNPQFADKDGGCRLAQRAVADGEESARKYLAACTVN